MRPAGTRGWLGRACSATAASAIHHGRVPTHAVTRREGSGLCAPHWTRKPRRGRAKAAVESSSPALPTRDRRGALFRSASTRPDQSQVPSSGSRVARANPRSKHQPAASTAACTAGNQAQSPHVPRRRRVRDRSPAAKWGSSRDESPRPACAGGREFSRRSSTAPSGPRRGLSPPAGSSRNSAAKVAWQDSSPLPSRPSLSHCQGGGKWRSASPKPWITPIRPVRRPRSAAHTRGRGRARSHSNQRVGGEGRRRPRGLGRLETPPPAPPLLLMDEPREPALACVSLRAEKSEAERRERKSGSGPG